MDSKGKVTWSFVDHNCIIDWNQRLDFHVPNIAASHVDESDIATSHMDESDIVASPVEESDIAASPMDESNIAASPVEDGSKSAKDRSKHARSADTDWHWQKSKFLWLF